LSCDSVFSSISVISLALLSDVVRFASYSRTRGLSRCLLLVYSSTAGLPVTFYTFSLLRNRFSIVLTGNMRNKCIAFGCKTDYDRQDSRSDEIPEDKPTLHSFPKDKTLFDKWVKAISRKDFVPSQYSCVCSKHFLPSDFVEVIVRWLSNTKCWNCSNIPYKHIFSSNLRQRY